MKIARTIVLFLAAWFVLSVAMTGCTCVVHHHHYHQQPGPVYVNGPPPAVEEHAQPTSPSDDHVWISGHWGWNDGTDEWEWVDGTWEIPPDDDATWEEPSYDENEGDWIYTPGHWVWVGEEEEDDASTILPPRTGGDHGHGHDHGVSPGTPGRTGPVVAEPGSGHDDGDQDQGTEPGTKVIKHPPGSRFSSKPGGEDDLPAPIHSGKFSVNKEDPSRDGGGNGQVEDDPYGDDEGDTPSVIAPGKPELHKKTPKIPKPSWPAAGKAKEGTGRTDGKPVAQPKKVAPKPIAAPEEPEEAPKKVEKKPVEKAAKKPDKKTPPKKTGDEDEDASRESSRR